MADSDSSAPWLTGTADDRDLLEVWMSTPTPCWTPLGRGLPVCCGCWHLMGIHRLTVDQHPDLPHFARPGLASRTVANLHLAGTFTPGSHDEHQEYGYFRPVRGSWPSVLTMGLPLQMMIQPAQRGAKPDDRRTGAQVDEKDWRATFTTVHLHVDSDIRVDLRPGPDGTVLRWYGPDRYAAGLADISGTSPVPATAGRAS